MIALKMHYVVNFQVKKKSAERNVGLKTSRWIFFRDQQGLTKVQRVSWSDHGAFT